jgi:hypothetical protein
MSESTPDDEPAEESAQDTESVADIRAEGLILERAIGGWKGMIDTGLPTVVFITVFALGGRVLTPALIAAVATGAVLAGWRLLRRQSLQQILTGFLGLAIAAAFSAWTGNAEDFFLPGLVTNAAYGTVFVVSILIGWPALGIVMGYLTGDGTTWRKDQRLRRTYAAASWIWVGVFFTRLSIQAPLYFAGAIEPLGVARVIMGWPLFLAGAYFTYRVLAPVYRERRTAHAAD